jgi:membrane-bound ClpP family serine protease
MRGLIPIGIVLVILWVLGLVVFKVAGFLIHLLVIVGIIMLIVGFFKRLSRSP